MVLLRTEGIDCMPNIATMGLQSSLWARLSHLSSSWSPSWALFETPSASCRSPRHHSPRRIETHCQGATRAPWGIRTAAAGSGVRYALDFDSDQPLAGSNARGWGPMTAAPQVHVAETAAAAAASRLQRCWTGGTAPLSSDLQMSNWLCERAIAPGKPGFNRDGTLQVRRHYSWCDMHYQPRPSGFNN